MLVRNKIEESQESSFFAYFLSAKYNNQKKFAYNEQGTCEQINYLKSYSIYIVSHSQIRRFEVFPSKSGMTEFADKSCRRESAAYCMRTDINC